MHIISILALPDLISVIKIKLSKMEKPYTTYTARPIAHIHAQNNDWHQVCPYKLSLAQLQRSDLRFCAMNSADTHLRVPADPNCPCTPTRVLAAAAFDRHEGAQSNDRSAPCIAPPLLRALINARNPLPQSTRQSRPVRTAGELIRFVRVRRVRGRRLRPVVAPPTVPASPSPVLLRRTPSPNPRLQASPSAPARLKTRQPAPPPVNFPSALQESSGVSCMARKARHSAGSSPNRARLHGAGRAIRERVGRRRQQTKYLGSMHAGYVFKSHEAVSLDRERDGFLAHRPLVPQRTCE